MSLCPCVLKLKSNILNLKSIIKYICAEESVPVRLKRLHVLTLPLSLPAHVVPPGCCEFRLISSSQLVDANPFSVAPTRSEKKSHCLCRHAAACTRQPARSFIVCWSTSLSRSMGKSKSKTLSMSFLLVNVIGIYGRNTLLLVLPLMLEGTYNDRLRRSTC